MSLSAVTASFHMAQAATDNPLAVLALMMGR
jgi:hypothetical protein